MITLLWIWNGYGGLENLLGESDEMYGFSPEKHIQAYTQIILFITRELLWTP